MIREATKPKVARSRQRTTPEQCETMPGSYSATRFDGAGKSESFTDICPDLAYLFVRSRVFNPLAKPQSPRNAARWVLANRSPGYDDDRQWLARAFGSPARLGRSSRDGFHRHCERQQVRHSTTQPAICPAWARANISRTCSEKAPFYRCLTV